MEVGGGRAGAGSRGGPAFLAAGGESVLNFSFTSGQAFIAGRLLDRHSHHSGNLAGCDECGPTVTAALRFLRQGRMRPYRDTATPYPWLGERVRLGDRWRRANEPSMLRRSRRPRIEMLRELMGREREFLRRGFTYLRSHEPGSSEVPYDPLYETLFLQYLRVKIAVFRMLVHPPEEHGLRNFQEHFNQTRIYAPNSHLLKPTAPDEPGLKVESSEYRVSPWSWFEILRRDDDEIEFAELGDVVDAPAIFGIESEACRTLLQKRQEGEPVDGGASVRRPSWAAYWPRSRRIAPRSPRPTSRTSRSSSSRCRPRTSAASRRA